MTDASSSHQQLNAERQRAGVSQRLREAMAQCMAETTTDGSGGVVPRRRISLAELLRRAGNVNKNTLKRPYHATLRKEVLAFLSAQAESVDSKIASPKPPTRADDLEHLAQLLVAAQIGHDEAVRRASSIETDLSKAKAEIAALRGEIAALRSQGKNVTPLRLK